MWHVHMYMHMYVSHVYFRHNQEINFINGSKHETINGLQYESIVIAIMISIVIKIVILLIISRYETVNVFDIGVYLEVNITQPYA